MKQATLKTLLWLMMGVAICLPISAAADQDNSAGDAKARAEDQAKAQVDVQANAQSASKAKMDAQYQKAMAEANRSQSEAQAAIAEARSKLEEAARQSAQANQAFSEARRAEMEAMRENLTRAHQELRESSRELSQINRELIRVENDGTTSRFIISGGDKPVIGVVLGARSDKGIKVLGVSPNGPAEKAGMAAGDVITAIAGRALSSVDKGGDVGNGLKIDLSEIKVSEPVIVSVERGNKTLDLTVIPEVREPLAWQSVMRLPSAPATPALRAAPGAPTAVVAPSKPTAPSNVERTVRVERMVVPEIDRAELPEQIAKMSVEIEQRRGQDEHRTYRVPDNLDGYEFYFDDMSELGDFALSDTNAWFGMPLTAGLRLAQIEPALGEYFNTDRGVLVLKAKPDNALLLQVGDVVLNLQGTDVNTPADFMRALREFAPGDELRIDIKRKRKNQTLSPVITEQQSRFFTPEDFDNFEVIVNSSK